MICPFCQQSDIQLNPGSAVCLSCQTVFEVDNRGECVFADTDSPKMPIHGQVCTECGLIQQEYWDSFILCGAEINNSLH